METMYERIRRLRTDKGMSQEELAIKSGFTSRSSISKIEKGQRDIRQGQISAIAKALGVSPVYLMDGEEAENIANFYAPLFASVSAGLGSTRTEPLGYHPCVVSSQAEAENTFCVIVNGDSMSPDIKDGDIIQIRKQSSVDYGDIAVVTLDETEHLVKKVEYGENYIRLISLNTAYEPIVLLGSDVLRCSVEGKVIGSFKRF